MELDPEIVDIDGAIISILVRNFFCFDEYEVELDRNVNFIVGRNGTGKSTFVTALVVGLGGKAAATKRGKKLSSFIKAGRNEASSEVKIKNSSPQSYKHDVYGDSITIVHTFNQSGGSFYKVKSESGVVQSTKYSDVKEIMSALNIQVENPICVLTQDDARDFLTQKEDNMYALFRQATNFDQTEKNYKQSLEVCKRAQAIYERKNDGCKVLESEYERWKQAHDRWLSLEEADRAQKRLENEFYWSEVSALEQQARAAELQAERAAADAQRHQALLDDHNQRHQQRTEALQEKRSRAEELVARQRSRRAELEALRERQREAEQGARAAAAHVDRQRAARRDAERNLHELRDEIDCLRRGGSQDGAQAEARVAAEAQARRALEEARARLDTQQHAAQQAAAQEQHARDRLQEAAAALAQRHTRHKKLLEKQSAVRSKRSEPAAVFGEQMVRLVERVRRAAAAGHFGAPPKGPVGAFIKVKDKRWASALEHGILKRALSTFCVNDEEDGRKLLKIIKEVYGNMRNKPGVTVSRYQGARHAVRPPAAPPGACAALDALLVPDADIANYLVDNHALEAVLLVPDHETAQWLTANAQNVPENLLYVVTEDCAQYYPAPNYRFYGSAATRPAVYLSHSDDDRIRQVAAEVEAARADEESARARVAACEEAAREAEQLLRRERAVERALRGERGAAERALAEAQDALPAALRPQEALEQEEQVWQGKVQERAEQLRAAEDAQGEARRRADNLAADLELAKAIINQEKEDLRKLNEEAESEAALGARGEQKRRGAERALATLREQAARGAERLAELRRQADDKRAAALQLCEPVENPREASVVRALMAEARAQLKRRAGGGSRAGAARGAQDALLRLRAARASLAAVQALVDRINNIANQHLKYCYSVQVDIVRQIQLSFQCVLKCRGYEGNVDVDLTTGMLRPRCWRVGVAGRGARAEAAGGAAEMSGGERSYAQVALLMALWECVDTPFCFLDEFTVCMDSANKRVIMDLLIDHAQRRRDRQFVLFTPLDISTLHGLPINILEIRAQQ